MSSLKLKVLTITRQNTSQEDGVGDDARSTPTSPISSTGQKKRDEFRNRGHRASYVQSKGALRVVCTEEPVGNGKVQISFDWGTNTPSPLSSPLLDARKIRRRGSIITTPSPLPQSRPSAPFSPAPASDSTPIKLSSTPPKFTSTPQLRHHPAPQLTPHLTPQLAHHLTPHLTPPDVVRRHDTSQERKDANLLFTDVVKRLDLPPGGDGAEEGKLNAEERQRQQREESDRNRRLSRLESIVAKECELIKIDDVQDTDADVDGASQDVDEDEEEGASREDVEEKRASVDRGTSFIREGRDDSESIVAFICSEDVMKIAVQLSEEEEEEEVGGGGNEAKYLVVAGPKDSNENIILGITCKSKTISLGIIIRIYAESEITLHTDGGVIFNSLNNQSGQGSSAPHYFKPVSVFSTWSLMQIINNAITKARERKVYKANADYAWTKYYKDRLTSDALALKDWNMMPDTYSQARSTIDKRFSNASSIEQNIKIGLRDIMTSGNIDLEDVSTAQLRKMLETRLKMELKSYKRFIDAEMLNILGQLDSPSRILDFLYLGSEWNASNLEELTGNEVANILNVAREIDNFFPGLVNYYNVREDDVESADMMKYWHETSKFLAQVEATGGRVLVHCKMGVSRSAATVIAFLMKSRRWSAEKAYAFVKERRHVIRPNKGFLRQLETFEGILNASNNRLSFRIKKKAELDEGKDSGASCGGDRVGGGGGDDEDGGGGDGSGGDEDAEGHGDSGGDSDDGDVDKLWDTSTTNPE